MSENNTQNEQIHRRVRRMERFHSTEPPSDSKIEEIATNEASHETTVRKTIHPDAQPQMDGIEFVKESAPVDSKSKNMKKRIPWFLLALVVLIGIGIAVINRTNKQTVDHVYTDQENTQEMNAGEKAEKDSEKAGEEKKETVEKKEAVSSNASELDSVRKPIPEEMRGKWVAVWLADQDGNNVIDLFPEVHCYAEFTDNQFIATMESNEINDKTIEMAYLYDDLIVMPESTTIHTYAFNDDKTAVAFMDNKGLGMIFKREGIEVGTYPECPDMPNHIPKEVLGDGWGKPKYAPEELMGDWVAVQSEDEGLQNSIVQAYQMGYDYSIMYSFSETGVRLSQLGSAEDWVYCSWGTMIRPYGDCFDYFQDYEAEYAPDVVHVYSRIPFKSFDIKYTLQSDGSLMIEQDGLRVVFARMSPNVAKQVALEPKMPAGRYDYTETDHGIRLDSYEGKETTITIPSTIDGKPVTEIGNIFAKTEQTIECLIIPASVNVINRQTIRHLERIELDSGNTAFQLKDGVLFSSDGTKLILYPNADSRTTYIIPEGTMEIKESAFLNAAQLTKIQLPKSLKLIDSGAFRNCKGLMEITIPDNVETIGDSAFKQCHALREISIPWHVIEIGRDIFEECELLEAIHTSSGSFAAFYLNKQKMPVKMDLETIPVQFPYYSIMGTWRDTRKGGGTIELTATTYKAGESAPIPVMYTNSEICFLNEDGICVRKSRWSLDKDDTLMISGGDETESFHAFYERVKGYRVPDEANMPLLTAAPATEKPVPSPTAVSSSTQRTTEKPQYSLHFGGYLPEDHLLSKQDTDVRIHFSLDLYSNGTASSHETWRDYDPEYEGKWWVENGNVMLDLEGSIGNCITFYNGKVYIDFVDVRLNQPQDKEALNFFEASGLGVPAGLE